MRNIKRDKIEQLIDLHEKYLASSFKIKAKLKADDKHQIDMVVADLSNPDRDNIFKFIFKLTQVEKDAVKTLMKFGQIYSAPSQEDFEFCEKNSRFVGDHDIDYMITRPLSKYLQNALMKLDLIKRNN